MDTKTPLMTVIVVKPEDDIKVLKKVVRKNRTFLSAISGDDSAISRFLDRIDPIGDISVELFARQLRIIANVQFRSYIPAK